MRRLNLTGQRFGKLVVTSYSHVDHGTFWHCDCDCGNTCIVKGSHLKEKQKACRKCAGITHGHKRGGKMSGTYKTWSDMIQRCNNANNTGYRNYGGRGIKVCERWHTFENFLADMGLRPLGKSLDRINVNGNYTPTNCRWATRQEQAENTRFNRWITYDGRTDTQANWARHFKVHPRSLSRRLDDRLPLPDAVKGLRQVA